MLKLTVLSDGCWRRLQHVLREVNEDLVELPTPQQVEVLNNLHENTNINTCSFCNSWFMVQNQECVCANLELFEQIWLLHHQRPEMLQVRNIVTFSLRHTERGGLAWMLFHWENKIMYMSSPLPLCSWCDQSNFQNPPGWTEAVVWVCAALQQTSPPGASGWSLTINKTIMCCVLSDVKKRIRQLLYCPRNNCDQHYCCHFKIILCLWWSIIIQVYLFKEQWTFNSSSDIGMWEKY